MTKDELRAKANELPLLPGVYLMMDKTGQVIYVGKAIKLKNRVSQYFQDTASHNDKTRRMVSQVDRFDTIIVRTEFEALILENSLIKRHMPRYNILLKDDKGYPFVRLDEKADYPRFTLVTRPAEDGARYFGPFGGRSETRQAIDAVCAALRLPTCSRRFPRDIGKERPCLNHHIGRCDGFCRPDGPDAAEYRRRIAQAVRLFEGRLRQVTAELTAQMTAAAEALDFEQAAALRDRIRALSVLSKNQKVIAGICADTDVWGVYTGPARAGCAVLHIENGDLLGRRVEVLPAAEDDAALLDAVVPQYYLDRELLPREILLPLPVEDMDTLSALLTERCGHTVTLRVPQRGQRRELLDIACRNAKEEVERVTSDAERTAGILRLLQELAGLPVLPRRMESYDISHTGGADQVASMVVFVDGRPLKRDYRRFQIQSCDGPDDYGAMAEVLERRFRRYLDGDGKFSPLPDLLLIDGGVQHARVAEEVAAKLHLSVPVLGMVKDDRHRTRALVTAQGMEIGIQTPPALFALIGRVQEEVHRFAITYHHQKHAKNAYRSQLDGIAGVGEARKRLLLQRFGTVKAIRGRAPPAGGGAAQARRPRRLRPLPSGKYAKGEHPMRYYATLGPACCEASALSALLRRGVSGFRLNVSHTMLAARRDWIDALHDAERSTGLAAQLMIDLRGPEVRIGALPSPLTLTAGEAVTLGADIPVEKDVLAALVPGMTVLLDDGAMALTVLDGGRCRVTRGGVLTGHKSLTPEGTELHRPALCEADLADLAQAAALGVSAVMQPFVRSADDLRTVRQAMAENGLAHAELFAKVEDQTGLDALPDWMDLCDVVTIARGDLGSSLPLEQLPAAQKHIAALCRSRRKPFLVVTQLLHSMIDHPTPTRAEVLDIYNAVLDGADCLMLTGETAQGRYPLAALDWLMRVAQEAQRAR